ncbi:MAG: dTDP-4-dehydrorhamnose reductase [Paludibacteraceae bacterium]|nr:dTDP-4-dehydrorhamnose reductase [Paludibacteraceae bacterium]
MNILITGAMGQLGNEMRLGTTLHDKHKYFFTDIIAAEGVEILNITDKQAVADFVGANAIDLIVNCAAYTNVDKAEVDEAAAERLNAEAVRNLAEAAKLVGAHMIHVSTDYVFSGECCVPYKEDDAPAPATSYGRTKLHGEQLLAEVLPDAVVIRTAWLYSSFGNNFVKTMIRLGLERDTLGVVFDQVGSPTYAADLAAAIYVIIEADEWHQGIYHFTDEGVCSWFDFTKEIHSLYNSQMMLIGYQKQGGADISSLTDKLIKTDIRAIRSEEYGYQTPRPHYSVLDKAKIKRVYGVNVPYWRDSLARCIASLTTDF